MKIFFAAFVSVLLFMLGVGFVNAETVQTTAVSKQLRFTPLTAGAVVCRSAKWEHASEEVTGNTTENAIVEMVPVPKNAYILEVSGYIEDLGAATKTVDIGDGTDPDRFFTALDGHTADVILADKTHTAGGVGYVYPADDTVDVLVRNATIAVNQTLVLDVCYKMINLAEDEAAAF